MLLPTFRWSEELTRKPRFKEQGNSFNFLMRRTTRSHCKWCGKDGELGPFLQSVCRRLSGKGKMPLDPNSS